MSVGICSGMPHLSVEVDKYKKIPHRNVRRQLLFRSHFTLLHQQEIPSSKSTYLPCIFTFQHRLLLVCELSCLTANVASIPWSAAEKQHDNQPRFPFETVHPLHLLPEGQTKS